MKVEKLEMLIDRLKLKNGDMVEKADFVIGRGYIAVDANDDISWSFGYRIIDTSNGSQVEKGNFKIKCNDTCEYLKIKEREILDCILATKIETVPIPVEPVEVVKSEEELLLDKSVEICRTLLSNNPFLTAETLSIVLENLAKADNSSRANNADAMQS